jgi:hypothetical protein
VPQWQRHQLVGVAALESHWGQNRGAQAHNPCGLKAKVDVDRWYRRELGRALPWFREAGHVGQQDPAVVAYAAFPDDGVFWRLWLARFVGRPAVHPYARDYLDAGRLLWAGDAGWCAALIRAGYSATRDEAGVLAAAASRLSCASRVERMLTPGAP